MNLREIKNKINRALDKLYKIDQFLFDEDLCERCITHKLTMYLEEQGFDGGYFVDYEYNKSHSNQKTRLKRVISEKGNYIDIIITKRDGDYRNDLACFEVKKWNTREKEDRDIEKLKNLTGKENFCYKYGFYIILGKKRYQTKFKLVIHGQLSSEFAKI